MSDRNLADEFRQAGIQAGDIVEISHVPSLLSDELSKSLGETPPDMEGWLVEVTAIGETAILEYDLQGVPLDETDDGRSYKLYDWTRATMGQCEPREHSYNGTPLFRKVGRKTADGIVWDYPDLMNIYSRCQTQEDA